MSHIGTLNERTLHRQLKELVAEPGDEFEVPLDGYVIDISRGDLLIEIQTGPLGPLGRKLDTLLETYEVQVVHPISVRSWDNRAGETRRSRTRRSIHDIFEATVSFPTLIDHPRLTIEVVLIEEDTTKVHDPNLRRRRGGWRTADREIRSIIERRTFSSAGDFAELLPGGLPTPFTTADISEQAGITRRLAQQMAYCLAAQGAITAGKRTKKGVEYRLAD